MKISCLPYCFTALFTIGLGLPAMAASSPKEKVRPLEYTGVNISGGDFDNPKIGVTDIYGANYIYPSETELTYFSQKGMNIIRFPFHWEDLQPSPMAPLDQDVLSRIEKVVTAANDKGMSVILDPHNYARYYGNVIGSATFTDSAFANFWDQLASDFKNNPKVWFGLMNEPHGMPTAQWLGAANAAIAAIRKAGAHNLILVPGNNWTGAGGWLDNSYGAPNGTVMLGVIDPENHYIYEVHQYLDSDGSGTHPTVVSSTIGSQRLTAFTQWCLLHHKQAFLGEFAVPNTPIGHAALVDMLSYMEQNRKVWRGFTWWSAGAWWGNYIFSLEPKAGQDQPQMTWLLPFLHGIR